MFGFLMLIPSFLMHVSERVKKDVRTKRSKEQALQEGKSYYYDANGTTCDIKTDLPFSYIRYGGDIHKVNPYTFTEIENISEKKRRETEFRELKKAIENGKSLYPFEGADLSKAHCSEKIVGIRYKHINTGKIYVKRKRFAKTPYYLNIKTGLCEYADGDNQKEIVEKVNIKQRELIAMGADPFKGDWIV